MWPMWWRWWCRAPEALLGVCLREGPPSRMASISAVGRLRLEAMFISDTLPRSPKLALLMTGSSAELEIYKVMEEE